MQEKARVKRNERGGMYARLCAHLCMSEGRKREEGWVVTLWKSGDNALALNPPSFRREGRIRAAEAEREDVEIRGERGGSSSDLSVCPFARRYALQNLRSPWQTARTVPHGGWK